MMKKYFYIISVFALMTATGYAAEEKPAQPVEQQEIQKLAGSFVTSKEKKNDSTEEEAQATKLAAIPAGEEVEEDEAEEEATLLACPGGKCPYSNIYEDDQGPYQGHA